MFLTYYQTYKKVCTEYQPQAFHKDINLDPVDLVTIKPFHMKKFYLSYIIII